MLRNFAVKIVVFFRETYWYLKLGNIFAIRVVWDLNSVIFVTSLQNDFFKGTGDFSQDCWVCYVTATATTIIFGTLKDGSPLINISSASNNCFSYINYRFFQNGIDPLSEIVDSFCQKTQNSM